MTYTLFYGNKRKSRRKFIAKMGNEEYIFGYDKENRRLTFYGRYDEKNDQHKHLKKINFW